MIRWCAVALLLLTPSLASAETVRSGTTRTSGFMLDVEFGVTSPTITSGLGGSIGGLWSFSPRLVLGGQIRRIGVGMFFGAGVYDTIEEAGGDSPASWSLTFGPAVDIEVWSRSAAGLFLAFGLPVNIRIPDDHSTSAGFSLDMAVGGRYWFDRWLALGLKAGSMLSFMFWNQDSEPPREWTSISWSIYAAIELRFVAGG